jgi:predicted nucleic acid-binding protein
VSTQVVNEVANVALTKFRLSRNEVEDALRLFRSFHIVTQTVETTFAALDLRESHKINFWDALIVAAALAGGCKTLYTEDLNHGQKIAGLKVVDPFA